jgi:hypothetical protein
MRRRSADVSRERSPIRVIGFAASIAVQISEKRAAREAHPEAPGDGVKIIGCPAVVQGLVALLDGRPRAFFPIEKASRAFVSATVTVL